MSLITMSSWLSSVLNLANTIVGVSILSMPFVFTKCGLALGLVLLYLSGYMTMSSCWLLLKSAQLTNSHTYEMLAYQTFGLIGKLLMILSNIGLLFGISIAMFIIIGDLLPSTVNSLLGTSWEHDSLRRSLLVLSGILIVFPLSMLRDIRKLAVVAALSMLVYLTLIVYLGILSLDNLFNFQWLMGIKYFDFSGVLTCLPILTVAFCCQTTLFLIRESHPDKSLTGMYSVVKAAVSFVATLYTAVGYLGLIAYFNTEIPGDILMNFPSSIMAFLVKLSFALTVVASIPLCMFACRVSVDSLIVKLFLKTPKSLALNAPESIPNPRFTVITATLVFSALFIAVFIPKVEFMLSITGAVVGSCIAFIFPAVFHLKASKSGTAGRLLAKIFLVLGVFFMVVSTVVIISKSPEKTNEVTLVELDPETQQPLVKELVTQKLLLPDNRLALSNEENNPDVQDKGVFEEDKSEEVINEKSNLEMVDQTDEESTEPKVPKIIAEERKEPVIPVDVEEEKELKQEVEKEGDEGKEGKDDKAEKKETVVVRKEDQEAILKEIGELKEKIDKLEKDQEAKGNEDGPLNEEKETNLKEGINGETDDKKSQDEEVKNSLETTQSPNEPKQDEKQKSEIATEQSNGQDTGQSTQEQKGLASEDSDKVNLNNSPSQEDSVDDNAKQEEVHSEETTKMEDKTESKSSTNPQPPQNDL